MKNSGVIGLIVLFIIGYVLIAIGAAAAIIGVGIGLTLLIRWIVKTIKDTKLRNKNKRIFYEFLISKYNISRGNEEEKIDNLLKDTIAQLLSTQSISIELLKSFRQFRTRFKKAFESGSLWYNDELLQGFSCNSSSLSRHSLSIEEKSFMGVSIIENSTFLLRGKGVKFYFYPNFVIAEINNDFKILDYQNISITDDDTIYVTEQSGTLISGSSPAFYEYLHQRVDGGPDRRYKNNPSTPVYCHRIFRIKEIFEIQMMAANSQSVDILTKSLRQFKSDLKNYPVAITKRIIDVNLTTNEFASQIRSIVTEHGKDILTYRVFINLLKDYKFHKQYPNIISIYEVMQQRDYMRRLIEPESGFSFLEEVKRNISQTITHEEDELNTVLAFLGYGLQFNR